MPELPDVTVYCEAIERFVGGEVLERVRLASPFVLRSVDPPLARSHGRRLVGVRRLGKRIVLELEAELFLVVHLMIAGRLRWRPRTGAHPVKVPRKRGLAGFDFAPGTILFTEEGTRKRASLHLVEGEAALAAHDPGGLDVERASAAAFASALRSENHTLKRALTDPRLFSGIGNAYSDEILHRAGLSPLKWSARLDDEEVERLRGSARDCLREWTERLRDEVGEGFPEKVTAFRPEMAVHGRFGKPCPRCGSPVQRIVYAENEANYCAACQTGGRLLRDRALSRILRDDWPRTLEGWEETRRS
jgi:formamidopyrimidine-DNA glycosylase